jgi:hypothetical protein
MRQAMTDNPIHIKSKFVKTQSMKNSSEFFNPVIQHPPLPKPSKRMPWSALRGRLDLLQWLAPAGMVFLVVIYETSIAKLIYHHWGIDQHFLVEIIFYGTLGPVLVFVLLFALRRWLEERETSDLQAQILELARKQVKGSQTATDEALQALFAASVFLTSLEAKRIELTSEDAQVLRQTQSVLDATIKKLRIYMEAKFF